MVIMLSGELCRRICGTRGGGALVVAFGQGKSCMHGCMCLRGHSARIHVCVYRGPIMTIPRRHLFAVLTVHTVAKRLPLLCSAGRFAGQVNESAAFELPLVLKRSYGCDGRYYRSRFDTPTRCLSRCGSTDFYPSVLLFVAVQKQTPICVRWVQNGS